MSHLVVQGHLDQIGQRRLVVDEQDADRRAVLPGDLGQLAEDGLPRVPERGDVGLTDIIMTLIVVIRYAAVMNHIWFQMFRFATRPPRY
jgi:hypothetical protein